MNEMEEEESCVIGREDIFVVDMDYEFDANTFFDFISPESDSDADVSQSWFLSASTHPPSPFIIKFKWREEIYNQNADASCKSNSGESMTSTIKNADTDREGANCSEEMSPSTLKTKAKSEGKSSGIRSSTLMKPTASHLAKLKTANDIYPNRSLERSPTSVTGLSDRSSKSSPLSVYQNATKRQKLDIGYLLKVARLKHKNLLLHKLSKVPTLVANNVSSRQKPTVPKEPNLKTAHRAQRHRSRNNPEIDESAKLKPSVSKELPANKKIVRTSPLPPQKKIEQPSHKFQRSIISGSISMNEITNNERRNYEDVCAPKQEKSERAERAKVCPLSKQKLKNPVQNRSSCNPPTELFKKLSLKSEVEPSATCRSKQQLKNKVPKENVPSSFRRGISVS